MFYFVFNIEEPDYFICNEINSYKYELFNNIVEFSYPKSCDQEAYHEGFSNLANILKDDFNYQSRPLYFVPVNLIYNFLKVFNISDTTNLLISTFLFQNIIALGAIIFLNEVISSKNSKENYNIK